MVPRTGVEDGDPRDREELWKHDELGPLTYSIAPDGEDECQDEREDVERHSEQLCAPDGVSERARDGGQEVRDTIDRDSRTERNDGEDPKMRCGERRGDLGP